ncbi:MAG: hypothetical protein CM1200mP41_24650 [Gammaproteobacteria bacterium]|nr:MAG: hypothetical protein CM1200mP41_24650 [Gammaproteobacteria bacterium]
MREIRRPNLGVEGMMLVGAVFGFIGATVTGDPYMGLFGAFSGIMASLIFAILTLLLVSNQVATGLALTIFGTGLQPLGRNFVVKLSIESGLYTCRRADGPRCPKCSSVTIPWFISAFWYYLPAPVFCHDLAGE